MENTEKINNVKKRLIDIFLRKGRPDNDQYVEVLKDAITVLTNENENIRPYAKNNLPGGIVYLKKNISTIILPDIHSRMDFFINVMLQKNSEGVTNLQKIANNELQIVCVGDALHAESRAIKRWIAAFEEYKTGFSDSQNMDEEMKEGLGVVEMIMEMKINFPENFHFLKGNHENIANENKEGNFPFRKFCLEGTMVEYYVKKFYSKEFFNYYYLYEKSLPLLVVGDNFLISHAEPTIFFNKDEVIEYRQISDVVVGLTWTDNGVADPDTVSQMLKYYLGPDSDENSYYFGGHRPVRDIYNLRANGRYVQIHNPNKFIYAYIKTGKDINIDEDVIEIDNKIKEIIN